MELDVGQTPKAGAKDRALCWLLASRTKEIPKQGLVWAMLGKSRTLVA